MESGDTGFAEKIVRARKTFAKTGKWCFVAKDVDDSPDKIFAFKPVLDDMELHLQLCILPREKTFLHLKPAGGSVVSPANTVKKVTAALFAKQNMLISHWISAFAV